MSLGNPGRTPESLAAWRRRRGGVRVYFCCCPLPLVLLLAALALLGHLAQRQFVRLLGKTPDEFGASGAVPMGKRAGKSGAPVGGTAAAD